MRWIASAAWGAAALLILAGFLAMSSTTILLGLGLAAVCLAIAGGIAAGGRIGLSAALLGLALGAIGTLVGQGLARSGGDGWVVAIGPTALVVVSYLAALQLTRELDRRRRVIAGRRRLTATAHATPPSGEPES